MVVGTFLWILFVGMEGMEALSNRTALIGLLAMWVVPIGIAYARRPSSTVAYPPKPKKPDTH